MADLIIRWLAPAILALVPAALRLWRGRSMARFLDDPAFAERLLGSRTPLIVVFAFVLAIEIYFWPRETWWSLPLLLLSLLSAGWPLRRVMFGETWSVTAYVSFYVRLVAAIYGFWIALMAAPWLTRIGESPWLASVVVGVILIAWNEQHGAALRWILRARPLAEGPIAERCRAIVTRSTIVMPNIERVEMNGGVLVNAVALPDTEQPTVLFTSSLLERLDEDEVVAIFAHEVAHLEHFNPSYLRRLRWAGWAIVATAVSVAPLLQAYAPRFESAVWGWPFLVLAYTSILTIRRQRHETESDARAVALTGNGEALVRGLVKLHALGRLPRRLDPNLEVHLSHPSLARRIQDIRATAGLTANSLNEPVNVHSRSSVVTLHDDRLSWSDADGTSHALPYAALSDLRIEAAGTGAAKLNAVDAQGRRWTLSLPDADVARVQAALDVIDARLRPAPVGIGVWRTLGVLVNLLMMVAGLGAGQLASTIVALLASFTMEKPLVRAAGTAGVVGGAIALRNGALREMALILTLSASLLLFIASRDRRESVGRWTNYLVPALGVIGLVMLMPLALGTGGFFSAHQVAHRWPAAAVFALAFAAAAAWPPRRGWRAAAAAGAAAAATVLVLGDTRTLDAVMRDPFLQKVDPPAVAHINGAPSSRTALDFLPERVVLSPRGESVAALVNSPDYEDATYFVGRAGAALTAVHADTARFVDERRLLVTDSSGSGTLLRLIDTERPAVAVWETRLDLNQPAMSTDRAGLQWRVLGLGTSGGIVEATGAVHGGAVARRQWRTHPEPENDPYWPLATSGDRLLARATAYDSSVFAALGAWSYWLRPFNSETKFVVVSHAGVSDVFRTQLHAQCEPAAYIGDGPLCSAHDGSRVHLSVLGIDDAAVTPIAKFDRALSFEVAPGWVTGWSTAPFALDLVNRRLVLIGDEMRASRWPQMMAASEDSIGVVWSEHANGRATILEIYSRNAIRDQRASEIRYK